MHPIAKPLFQTGLCAIFSCIFLWLLLFYPLTVTQVIACIGLTAVMLYFYSYIGKTVFVELSLIFAFRRAFDLNPQHLSYNKIHDTRLQPFVESTIQKNIQQLILFKGLHLELTDSDAATNYVAIEAAKIELIALDRMVQNAILLARLYSFEVSHITYEPLTQSDLDAFVSMQKPSLP